MLCELSNLGILQFDICNQANQGREGIFEMFVGMDLVLRDMSCFTTFGCIEFLSLICFDILKASRNFGVFCSFLSVRKPVVEESDHVWFTSLTISELAKMNNKWWEICLSKYPTPNVHLKRLDLKSWENIRIVFFSVTF